MIEIVHVDFRLAGLGLHASPSAHLPAEGLIAHAGGLRGPCFLVVRVGIEFQKRVRVGLETLFSHRVERRRFYARRREHSSFVVVRADEQRHVGLFALRENRVNIRWKQPAVDVRSALEPGDPHQFLRRFGAQRGDRIDARRARELSAGLFRFGKRASRRKLAAAFADGALKQAFGERSRHEVIHAPGTRRFTENGDPFRVAAERGDILLDPFKRRNLIEEGIIARKP